MKKVLIISYYFPPDPQIGGLRAHGLAKYLPEFGWEPIILTKKNKSRQESAIKIFETPNDEYNIFTHVNKTVGLNTKATVKQQIGFTTKIKKSLINFFFNIIVELLTYPDAQKEWYKHAIKNSCEIIDTEKIHAIISSSSPVTSHIIASSLKNKYGVFWVADLRDLWTQNPYYPYSFLRKVIEKRLEIKTFRNTDVLVTTTNKSRNILKQLHSKKNICSIHNGFDSINLKKLSFEILTNKFTITYTGSLYHGKRDPSSLFQAINELISEQKINRNDIEVRFYGPQENWLTQEIKTSGLEDIVHNYGIVPRDYVLQRQIESQLLLLLLWNNPSESSVCPGKIYEYFAARRPIMAVGGPKGVVSEVLNETRAGIHLASLDEIKCFLEEHYKEYKLNGFIKYRGDQNQINKYSQKEMAKKFSCVLNDLVRNL